MTAPRPTRLVRTLAAALASVALACAGGEPHPPLPARAPTPGRVARVEVAFAEPGAGGLAPGAPARVAGLVRQSARDWLEHEGRLAADGPLALEVTLHSLRLRSALTTWLFAWAVAPDQLAARVEVRRDGALAGVFATRVFAAQVESALAGYGWRDPEERLERLARRLGHRIADGL